VKKLNSTKAWAWGMSLVLMLAAGGGKGWSQGIIYVVPQPQPSYSLFYPGTLDLNIDINGDGTTDFILESGSSDINYAALIPQGSNMVVTMNSFVAAMTNGETIGSSLDPVYQWSNASSTIGFLVMLLDSDSGGAEDGNFVGKSSGYMGFDLVDNGTNYYGWMYISSPGGDDLNGDAGIYGVIENWAYQNSPNTPIEVGAVPEPSTWALLTAGAVLMLRRRKIIP
jgi:hypothetical protein